MAKITKASLAELAKKMQPLTREEQASIVGGTQSTYTVFGKATNDQGEHALEGLNQSVFSTQVGHAGLSHNDMIDNAKPHILKKTEPKKPSTPFTPSPNPDDNYNGTPIDASPGEKPKTPIGPSGAYGDPKNPSGAYGDTNDPSGAYGDTNDPSGAYGDPNDPSGAYGDSNDSPGYAGENNDNSDTRPPVFDINAAVKYLKSKAKERSGGYCARIIMNAMEAGGYKGERKNHAHQLNDGYLQGAGFKEVSLDNYTPQIGDVVVYEAMPGHASGHTAMYGGNDYGWASDFKQRDMAGGAAYRSSKASYKIYRYSN